MGKGSLIAKGRGESLLYITCMKAINTGSQLLLLKLGRSFFVEMVAKMLSAHGGKYFNGLWLAGSSHKSISSPGGSITHKSWCGESRTEGGAGLGSCGVSGFWLGLRDTCCPNRDHRSLLPCLTSTAKLGQWLRSTADSVLKSLRKRLQMAASCTCLPRPPTPAPPRAGEQQQWV